MANQCRPLPKRFLRRSAYWVPKFVIWTGDCIEGYGDSASDADGEYSTFLGLAKLCGVPVINVPGNHELADGPVMLNCYRRDMGPEYGSFDYGGSHFIGLNSTPIVGGESAAGTIDPDQLAWLKADLEANKSAVNIFVFFHHFMYGPTDPDTPDVPGTGMASVAKRDELHALFKQYGVRAVFNGHSHMFYHVVKDGIDYFIAGNAGAPLDAAPENGGFLGYTLVHVAGKAVTTDNVCPWTLSTRTVSGADGKARQAVVEVSSYAFENLPVEGISVRMPAAPSYSVTGFYTTKKKTKPVDVAIDHTAKNSDGSESVHLSFELTHARTTVITVAAGK